MAKKLDRLLSMDELVRYLGVSQDTVERMISKGHFPRGTKVSPAAPPSWRESVILKWLDLRPLMYPDEEKPAKGQPPEKS